MPDAINRSYYGLPIPMPSSNTIPAMQQAAQAAGLPGTVSSQQSQGPFNYTQTGVDLPISHGGGQMSPVNTLGSTSALGPDLAAMLAMLSGAGRPQPEAQPGAVTFPSVSTGPAGPTPLQKTGLEQMYGPVPSNTPTRTPSEAEQNWESLVSSGAAPPVTYPAGTAASSLNSARNWASSMAGRPVSGAAPSPTRDANVSGPPTDANTGQAVAPSPSLDKAIATAMAAIGAPAGAPAPAGNYPTIGGSSGFSSLFGLPVPRQQRDLRPQRGY